MPPAEIVSTVNHGFQIRAKPSRHNAISAKLNERNVRTARGGAWTHVQVGAILILSAAARAQASWLRQIGLRGKPIAQSGKSMRLSVVGIVHRRPSTGLALRRSPIDCSELSGHVLPN